MSSTVKYLAIDESGTPFWHSPEVPVEKPAEPAPPVVKPPASGEWLEEIVSDDGTAKAYAVRNPGHYVLDRDITAPETALFLLAPDISLDLGQHSIEFGASGRPGCAGINPLKMLSKHAGYGNNDVRFSKALAGAKWHETPITIRGGHIFGKEPGNYSVGIGGDYVPSLDLAGVSVNVVGDDACGVKSANIKMINSRSVVFCPKIKNRHQLPGNIYATKGSIYLENCSLYGGHNGAVFRDSRGTVKDCFISNYAVDTNGYAVHTYRSEGVKILNSWLIPRNGRGVMIGGMEDSDNPEQITVTGNHIFAMERPNNEFGSGLEPTCLRSRYDVRNLLFEDNWCLAIGGTLPSGDLLTTAIGVYLTNKPGSLNNRIINNHLAAALLGPVDYDKNHTAAPIGLIGEGNYGEGEVWECLDLVQDNELSSNCHMACLSHGDGGCNLKTPVNVTRMRWLSAQEIIAEFFASLRESMADRTTDLETVKQLQGSLSGAVDPPTTDRAYFDTGRSGGSKATFFVPNAEDLPVISSRSRRYAFNITFNNTRYIKAGWSDEVTKTPLPATLD